MLMPYGQKRGEKRISIDINALRAKERTKPKQFLNIMNVDMNKITTLEMLIFAFPVHSYFYLIYGFL